MDAQQILDEAHRLELLAEEIYLRLARRAEGSADLRVLCSRLADEERQHAGRMEVLARHAPPTPVPEADSARVRELLRSMEAELLAVLDEAGRGDVAPTTQELVRRMADFEVRFASAHAEHLAGVLSPGMRPLLEMLARQDRQHAEILAKAAT